MEFALTAHAKGTIDDVEIKVTSALKDVGFGILTRIEVDKVLKDKLGAESPPYRILGACNPHIAMESLSTNPEAGVFLPCSVCLRQEPNGTVSIWALSPQAVVATIGNPILLPHGQQAQESILKAINNL